MLKTLKIHNLILIDDLEIDFNLGFTVLTGETGAGKSIILDALLLALGGRANNKLLKDTSKNASVTAIFLSSYSNELNHLLEELGLEPCGELILRRVLLPDGRSKAYLNDVSVTNNTLSILRENLVEICGQHESRGLLSTGSHMKLLDALGGYEKELETVARTFDDWNRTNQEYTNLLAKKDKAHIEYHYLQAVISELEELKVQVGEEQIISDKRKILLDESKIKEIVQKSISYFEQSTLLPRLYALEKDLSKFEGVFEQAIGPLVKALSELEEFHAQIFSVGESLLETQTLAQIEDRLFKIRSVARKHNISPDEMPEFLKKKKQELELLGSFDATIAKLSQALSLAEKTFMEQATYLSALRKKAAQTFREKVLMHLKDLKMEKSDFMVEIEPEQWSRAGMDAVKFLVKTNPDSPIGELSKIASGGELSRIMLSIKIALTNVDSIPTLIFDEIDSGISGAVSTAVGKKLSELSRKFQILSVTHQPQVTASADNHLLVEKHMHVGKTKVVVSNLASDGKLKEIARMISGEKITDESLKAAQTLIKTAA